MLSKNKITLYQNLGKKKFRDKHSIFIVEGEKIITEILLQKKHCPYQIKELIVDESYAEQENGQEFLHFANHVETIMVKSSILKKISCLQTFSPLIAIIHKPQKEDDLKIPPDMPCIILDNIQDPGNLGTLIRTSSWFGINTLYCSKDTVDIYNPKVIQASMGAFIKTKLYYTNIQDLLKKFTDYKKPIYGTFLEGDSIHDVSIKKNAAIVFGNEGNGIHSSLDPYFTHRITIPPHSTEASPESLNISVAHGIICAAYHQQNHSK